MSTAISPEAILKELSDLWVSLGKQEESEVLRACAMTLIMACGEEEDPGAASQLLAELIHENPSRAIILHVVSSQEPVLESRVVAQCWMPFGKRQQICCEQIELTASPSRLADVQRILGALVAPDLPVMLVCRSPRLFGLPKFQRFLSLANKVVTDSHGSAEPWTVMQRIADLNSPDHSYADLSWTRLTPLRREISSAFEKPGALEQLAKIESIEITHCRNGFPSECLYLTAWLQTAIGREVPVTYRAEGDEVISAVDLLGPDLRLHFQGPPVPEVCALLREELAISGYDSVYNRVLPAALAQA